VRKMAVLDLEAVISQNGPKKAFGQC